MGGQTLVKSWPDDFRYADGDVVLRFSNQPSGILLLHGRVLSQHSEVFKAMFSTTEAKPLSAAEGATPINLFEADLLLDFEDGVTYLQTKVSQQIALGGRC
jgi:hypothetical protein